METGGGGRSDFGGLGNINRGATETDAADMNLNSYFAFG